MSTSDDYRAMAEECFRRAQEAQTNNERQGYLELARTWLAAASKVDCGPRTPCSAVMPLAIASTIRAAQFCNYLFTPNRCYGSLVGPGVGEDLEINEFSTAVSITSAQTGRLLKVGVIHELMGRFP